MTKEKKIEEEVRIAALPDDEQIEEITPMFSRLTPDQQSAVRALMIESDEKLAE